MILPILLFSFHVKYCLFHVELFSIILFSYSSRKNQEQLSFFLRETLILAGFSPSIPNSPFFSSEEAQRMCMSFPGATFQEIPGATHMPAQENPDAFKRMILDFLSEY